MKSAVISFPGSNCDRDLRVALEKVTGRAPHAVWHGDSDLPDGLDFIGLPGGFSYGDYLRCGAMAARSPIVDAVKKAAEKGVAVLGICNGFQVLIETGLLPGALMRNAQMDFVCRNVTLEVANNQLAFTRLYQAGEKITIPVAHHDGNYYADKATLDMMEQEGRIAFRYAEQVNGSQRDIAGITDSTGRILGMMPHPERRIEAAHGGDDGVRLFASLAESLLSA